MSRPSATGPGPVVDAHVHLWARDRFRYAWLEADPVLGAAAGVSEYSASAPGVSRCVFVQADASDAVEEARWVQSLASQWPQLAGIVAQADLLSEGLGEQLDQLMEIPAVVGVRHLLQDLSPEVLTSDKLARGLETIAERGLTFDACVRWWQLDSLAALLERTRPGTIVLDHLGKPPIGNDAVARAAWHRGMERLAQLPEVAVKISGLPAESDSPSGLRAAVPDLVRETLALFGSDRAMLGSDWPVSTRGPAGLEPPAWFEQLRSLVPEADWARIAHDTAKRVYTLPTV